MEYEYATRKYANQIYNLQHANFKPPYAYSKEDILDFIKNNSIIIVISSEISIELPHTNRLVGFIIFAKTNYEFNRRYLVNTIMSLAVDCKFRKQGIAHRLITILKSFKKEWYLHVKVDNLPAISLYKSLDFVIIDKIKNYYKQESLDGYYMRYRDKSLFDKKT